MQSRKLLPSIVLTVCIPFIASGCAAGAGRSDLMKAEQLATEQGRVYDLEDPVSKTKSYIKVSEFLLEFAEEAAHRQDGRSLTTRLDQYAATIKSARDTMLGSQQNANQRRQGIRNLGKALDSHLERLERINQGLLPNQRQHVGIIIEIAQAIRNETQRALSLSAG